MVSGLIGKLIDLWPLLVWLVFFIWWIRKASIRSAENLRINTALLEANLEMAARLRNIEALLENEKRLNAASIP